VRLDPPRVVGGRRPLLAAHDQHAACEHSRAVALGPQGGSAQLDPLSDPDLGQRAGNAQEVDELARRDGDELLGLVGRRHSAAQAQIRVGVRRGRERQEHRAEGDQQNAVHRLPFVGFLL
jgi:hypothetical protein